MIFLPYGRICELREVLLFVPIGTFENSPAIYCRDELNTNTKVL